MSKPDKALHDCPRCGTKNFTTKGLASHNCAKHAARREASLAIAAEKAPALDHVEMGRQLTEAYHKAIGAMPAVLTFGAMVLTLEKHCGDENRSTRGSVSGGRGNKGGIRDWLRNHAPEVPIATALRFRDVTLGIAKEYEQLVGAKVAKQFTLPALVTTPAAQLSAPVRAKQQALFDYVAGTSQRSWLDRLRPPKDRGGSRTASLDKTYDPNAPVENARDLLLHPLRAIAMRWREKEAKLPLWSHLPTEELREIDGILLDLRNDLKAALKTAPTNGEAKEGDGV